MAEVRFANEVSVPGSAELACVNTVVLLVRSEQAAVKYDRELMLSTATLGQQL
jgi:hypothetical protein